MQTYIHYALSVRIAIYNLFLNFIHTFCDLMILIGYTTSWDDFTIFYMTPSHAFDLLLQDHPRLLGAPNPVEAAQSGLGDPVESICDTTA